MRLKTRLQPNDEGSLSWMVLYRLESNSNAKREAAFPRDMRKRLRANHEQVELSMDILPLLGSQRRAVLHRLSPLACFTCVHTESRADRSRKEGVADQTQGSRDGKARECVHERPCP